MPDQSTTDNARSARLADRSPANSRFSNPALAALVVLPFGVLAAISMVRELREPRHPVSGVAFVDGVPRVGVELTFHRIDSPRDSRPVAKAWTNSEGRFQVRTLGVASGMPIGEYVATARRPSMEIAGESLTEGDNELDRRYADPVTSPLRVVVGPGVNVLEPWQLERCRCEVTTTHLARR